MSKVEMPEPNGHVVDCLPNGGMLFIREIGGAHRLMFSTMPLYSHEQMRAYAEQVRDAALEEAIAICLQEGGEWDSDAVQAEKNYALVCADRVLGLKGGTA